MTRQKTKIRKGTIVMSNLVLFPKWRWQTVGKTAEYKHYPCSML